MLGCDLDQNLNVMHSIVLSDQEYGKPNRMKRMRGFEILVIACNKHFAIIEWTPTGFVMLASLRNIHENPVCDFVLRGKFLYSKALTEQHIKITELGANPMDSILVDSPYSDF